MLYLSTKSQREITANSEGMSLRDEIFKVKKVLVS